MEGFGVSELKDVKGVWASEGAIEEPNDSDRFISGGERSEETVRRWLGGVLYVEFVIVCDRWRRGFVVESEGVEVRAVVLRRKGPGSNARRLTVTAGECCW
jgi:hypothetical protein